MAVIDYYFTASSPWAYLGHAAIRAVARRHGARLSAKPVVIADVWKASGSVPLAERSPTRQRYRLVELQRYAELRGLPIVCKPGPVDPSLADLCVAAIVLDGGDPLDFLGGVLSARWAEDRDIGDEAVLASLLESAGFGSAAVIERARSQQSADLRDRNTAEAIAADAIGVPAYVLNGEVFWGQDRIDLLDRALAAGRAPFRPL
jgi:2-hydroxychromene-2-carboxylate isomerase